MGKQASIFLMRLQPQLRPRKTHDKSKHRAWKVALFLLVLMALAYFIFQWASNHQLSPSGFHRLDQFGDHALTAGIGLIYFGLPEELLNQFALNIVSPFSFRLDTVARQFNVDFICGVEAPPPKTQY